MMTSMGRQYPGKESLLKVDMKKLQIKEKSTSKKEITKEFYPNKQRRDVKIKPVVLKAKNEFVVVGELNKRKRTIPRRGVSRTPSPQPATIETTIQQQQPQIQQPKKQQQEQSIEELIQLTETEGLTDEDLIEILTCPSPVWWEPCDYDEEPIMRRGENSMKEAENLQKAIKNEDLEELKSFGIKKNNSDDGFMKKRHVLENLLSNIKKNSYEIRNEISEKVTENIDVDKNGHDTKENKNQNAPKKADKTIINMTYKELLKKREIELKNSERNKSEMSDIIQKSENFSADKDYTVEVDKKDLSAEKDIKSANFKENQSEKEQGLKKMVGDVKFDENTIINKEMHVTENNKSKKRRHSYEEREFTEKNVKHRNINNNKDKDGIQKNNDIRKRSVSLERLAVEDLENIYIPMGPIEKRPRTDKSPNRCTEKDEIPKEPTNLSPLKQFQIYSSPESIKIIDIDSSSVSIHDGLDTISDTNIQFLNEDQLSEDSVSIHESICEDVSISESNDLEGPLKNAPEVEKESKNDDYVVIYKIVDKNETGVDSKAKNFNMDKCENSLESVSAEKSGKTRDICKTCIEKTKILIRVENEELMYYCSKCSSIFKTEFCNFCEDKKMSSELSLVCQICMCECCCEENLKTHVTNHIGTM